MPASSSCPTSSPRCCAAIRATTKSRRAGLFVADGEGDAVEAQFWDEVGSYIDFTDRRAAEWWRAQIKEALLAHGIVATWNDNNEYEIWDARARIAGFGAPRAAAGMRPVQPLLMTRASRHAQIEAAPGRRPYVVTRSGMAGLQRYAQTWSGDNLTEWKTPRYNARMALGLALSGVSNSGHDVGGFAGPAPSPELLVRWVQAGVLMPRFSIHSWNDDRSVNEPWMHPEALPAIRRLMALRQTLIPFLYDLLHRYHAECEPMVRPTWLDFPDDPAAWAECDEHLLGPDLLVAPVVEQGAETRSLRPPAGADWIHVWTGERIGGGTVATLAAPLDGPPPLLARAGSAMLVDLARGGWRPGPYRRGVWLFPPAARRLRLERGRGCRRRRWPGRSLARHRRGGRIAHHRLGTARRARDLGRRDDHIAPAARRGTRTGCKRRRRHGCRAGRPARRCTDDLDSDPIRYGQPRGSKNRDSPHFPADRRKQGEVPEGKWGLSRRKMGDCPYFCGRRSDPT